MITQERLKELLSYCESTGLFTRLVVTASSVKVGDVAGGLTPQGYRTISLDNERYLAHRLAWLYVYGTFPPHEIDHINHYRDDNRIENLRAVTRSEQNKNLSLSKRNRSGVIGVCWDKAINKWRAQICINTSNTYLGVFKDLRDAIKARKGAEREYLYHINHGDCPTW